MPEPCLTSACGELGIDGGLGSRWQIVEGDVNNRCMRSAKRGYDSVARARPWTELHCSSAGAIDEVTRRCRRKGNCMFWRDEVLLLLWLCGSEMPEARLQARVKRLARRIPCFESIWKTYMLSVGALLASGLLNPFSSNRTTAPFCGLVTSGLL